MRKQKRSAGDFVDDFHRSGHRAGGVDRRLFTVIVLQLRAKFLSEQARRFRLHLRSIRTRKYRPKGHAGRK